MGEKVTRRLRKKVCCHCKRKLYRRNFYKSSNTSDGLSHRCKECEKACQREQYIKHHKIPDGITRDPSTGLLMNHRGASRKIFWSSNMISILKRYFPTTKNDEMPDLFFPRISKRTIIRKARELGLEKDPEWLRGCWDDSRVLALAASRKGNNGWLKKGHKFLGNQYVKINQ